MNYIAKALVIIAMLATGVFIKYNDGEGGGNVIIGLAIFAAFFTSWSKSDDI